VSRAFVKESDQEGDALPERVVSPHPNLVTAAGLRQIETQVQQLEADRVAARTADDRTTLARIDRDLRYWLQRRGSARLIEPAADLDVARFGVRVTLRFRDGKERSLRIVGEDEADPARGLVSWVAPIGSALTGAAVGDELEILGGHATVVALDR